MWKKKGEQGQRNKDKENLEGSDEGGASNDILEVTKIFVRFIGLPPANFSGEHKRSKRGWEQMRTKIEISPQKKEIIKGVPKRLTKNME